MENFNAYVNKESNRFSLSKSRFKSLIDQIENKITQNHFSHKRKNHLLISPDIKSSSIHIKSACRMLPLYFKEDFDNGFKTSDNQKKISVNLEFNKLILNKKNQFVQHSPNQKDLNINLPQLKISMKNKQKFTKNQKIDRNSSRWKLNLKKTQNLLFFKGNENIDNLINQGKFKRIVIEEGQRDLLRKNSLGNLRRDASKESKQNQKGQVQLDFYFFKEVSQISSNGQANQQLRNSEMNKSSVIAPFKKLRVKFNELDRNKIEQKQKISTNSQN